MQPFIKWAGGKRQLLNELNKRIPNSYNDYYEPFIGGGAFLFDVKFHNAHINDINTQLINVYRTIKTNHNELKKIIFDFDAINCDKSYFYDMRQKYNEKIKNNILDVECAALFIWLNKHCFNGLYRVNTKGLFNVPWNNKETGQSIDENNIDKIHTFLQNVSISNVDFEIFCKSVKSGDFVYFDSPYVPVSTTADFTSYTKDGFNYDDHVRLSNLFKELDKRGAKIMLSNNNVELVHKLYTEYNINTVDARRAINSDATKRTGKEVIITNYDII